MLAATKNTKKEGVDFISIDEPDVVNSASVPICIQLFWYGIPMWVECRASREMNLVLFIISTYLKFNTTILDLNNG